MLDTKPRHVGFTLNSDTPYAPVLLDLKDGPMVVEKSLEIKDLLYK